MKVKMKRCFKCKTLLSNSTKICSKCGSNELEKGFYSDESNYSIIYNKHLTESIGVDLCPTCCASKLNTGECIFCGD